VFAFLCVRFAVRCLVGCVMAEMAQQLFLIFEEFDAQGVTRPG
jgi:hypothetical protein